jgi:flagellar basal-body rod protein FlgF
MDKLIFMSAVAAKNAMYRQDNVSNNLANVNTPGFRSQLMAFRSSPVVSKEGQPTRAFSMESTVGFDKAAGSLQSTGRALDVAVQGSGWFSVQTPRGEAYTRAGHFQLNNEGQLVTSSGFPVLGEDGPIVFPENFDFEISDDGFISGFVRGQGAQNVQQLGRLKLVDPQQEVVRSEDGFFRRKDGRQADAVRTAKVASGYLESSNVNPVESMVQMIAAQRDFEMQLRMISNADQNARSANSLFSLN